MARYAFVLRRCFGCWVLLTMILLPLRTFATPVVPGFTVEPYANVVGPVELAFAPSGVLYVGRDDTLHGGDPYSACRIHRIGLGGTVVEEYGPAIVDPDAVIFDATGRFSGTSGSVLVGGMGGGGSVTAILPDQTTVVLWNSGFANPTLMTYDNSGRLLFSDPTAGKIMRSDGGNPYPLVNTGNEFHGIAVSPDDRIFTWPEQETTIRIYGSNGALIDAAFASGLQYPSWSALAFGTGGVWGFDMYTVSAGDLLRFDATIGSPTYGQSTVIGTGFGTPQGGTPSDIAFGPDGALYASMFDEDYVLRVIPEPTSLSLLAIGCVALLGRRR